MIPTEEKWIEVRVTGAKNRDAVVAALFAEGSLGVQENGDAIVTHFPASADLSALRALISGTNPDASISIDPAVLPEVLDWQGTVRRQIVGALTIAPPWLARDLDPQTTIVIEPAMAFGTGDHPTTRGVLRLMQTTSLRDKVVADLGAGSAILAIAAAKLGARKVVAVELDPDASGNANENIARNAVQDRVHYIEGDAFAILPLVAPVGFVFANILSSVLIDLLPAIRDSLEDPGKAILSGILADERPTMLQALHNNEWNIDDEDFEGEWWSVLISRA
ncbi:MAG TPA: 50S ribosomal protein L11 methyltransferase [Gemmatimonadaceae bacterium]|nr:50S ribosomal protein L11 methyltransferase [Gemmatimonadaceae bacterium]